MPTHLVTPLNGLHVSYREVIFAKHDLDEVAELLQAGALALKRRVTVACQVLHLED